MLKTRVRDIIGTHAIDDRDILLTRHEAAEYLRRSVPTLERWASQGIGPRAIKLGGKVGWGDPPRTALLLCDLCRPVRANHDAPAGGRSMNAQPVQALPAPWPEWRLPVREHLRPKPKQMQLDFVFVRGLHWECTEWDPKDGTYCERKAFTTDMPLANAEALECGGQA